MIEPMDFKKHFSQLRTEEDSSGLKMGLGKALFGVDYWFQSVGEIQEIEQEEVPVMESERDKTLSSLEDFVLKESESKEGEATLKFPGGELKVKPLEEMLGTIKFDRELSEFIENKKIKTLFLGDTFQTENDHEVDLLGKMIGAMKLEEKDFERLPFEQTDENSDEFQKMLTIVCEKRPELIITLGAVATNILMGKKERLSRVHGKIFKRTFSFSDSKELEVYIMPVFHPDFLKINPNMKRAAWIDLQKAMEFLEI